MYAGVIVFLGYGLTRMALTPHFATANERLLSEFQQEFSRPAAK